MNKFKERLRELRTEKGLTQINLGKLLGYGKTAVSDWESQGVEPTFDTLIKLAKLFNVSLDYLLGLDD